MPTADLPALRKRIGSLPRSLRPLLFEMLRHRVFLRGSVYELKTRCGKASCVCGRGELHRRWVLTESLQGRKRLRVVPADQIETWRRWADDVRGTGLACGHFIAEEAPEALLAELLPFLSGR